MVRYSSYIMFLISLIFLFTFCDKQEDPGNDTDPANLTIEVLYIDHESGYVELQASADNATLYQLYIGNSGEPETVNNTGYFEYTFGSAGNYMIEIRAYGASGRYIKETKQISISPENTNPVPLDSGYFSPDSYQGYTLMWQDEFSGNSVNTSFWGFDIGDGCPNLCGWGNNELEYYRAENATVADDVLTIEARQENFSNRNYTSARLTTKGKYSFQYGRVDIRALLPRGQGMWPALWMLGDNINSVGWPASGEIDIMEMVGGNGREREVHGTAHWDNGEIHASYGNNFVLPSGTFAEAYHVFSIVWDENSIKWFVNNQQYNEVTITSSDMSEFHQPFHILFNVAVGGIWPGNPDATTVFPQTMKVDYIRVFQEE